MKTKALAIIILCLVYGAGYLSSELHKSKAPRHDWADAPVINEAKPLLTFEDLLDAISWVESKDNSNAIGACGGVGIFQIRKIFVDDVNRIDKEKCKNDKYRILLPWEYSSRKNPVSSRWIVRTYLLHYATEERLGKNPTAQDMARIFNGGPNGWKLDCTKPYWEKVKARLAGI